MSEIHARRAPRRALFTAAAAGLLLGTAVHGAAAQDALGGLLGQLFGAPQAAPQPVPQFAPVPGYAPDAYRARRAGKPRLRTRYAALPKSEPLAIRVTDRQKPLDMKAGAAAALMRDETLRPGDIVVLKDGARVFSGSARDKVHAMRDFEPAERSPYLDRKTRRLLAAMITPVGALPAEEARRMIARLKRNAPAKIDAAEPAAEQVAVRVINPWTTNP
ncbi:hypothetical protein [Methylobacterium sp. A54F]